jgi:hypothetical protein
MDMQDIEDVLSARQETHGNFSEVSHTVSGIEEVLAEVEKYFLGFGKAEVTPWRPEQKVALRMIILKIARIAAGDPLHADHWLDIAGYAVLAAKSIPNRAGD